LGEIGSSDFDKAPEAIAVGEKAARAAFDRLAALSLPAGDYDRWLAGQRATPAPLPVIASLRVDNHSPIGDNVVRAQIRTQLGKPLNLETLTQDLKRIYSIDTFERADFRLAEKAGKTDLIIETKEKSWGPHYLRFGISLSDDLKGGAGYNLSGSLTSTALNRLGAEWINKFQIGDTPTFSSEFYQPIDASLRTFIAPRIEYKSWNINRYEGGVRLAQYRATALEGGFDIGRQLENWGQIRLGIRRGFGDVEVRSGAPEPERQFNSGLIFSSFSYNRLDSFNFPRRGTAVDTYFLLPREELGSDYSGKSLLFNWLTAISFDRHTVLTGLTVLSALDSDAPLQSSYPLGGFLNLSGYANEELSGQHTGLARLVYYYRLGSAGLGNYTTQLYTGFSLEAGNAWASKSDISAGSLIYAGSLLVGAETYLGPLYLAYGRAEGGKQSLYLYLGHKF
jgi:NTE family protein